MSVVVVSVCAYRLNASLLSFGHAQMLLLLYIATKIGDIEWVELMGGVALEPGVYTAVCWRSYLPNCIIGR